MDAKDGMHIPYTHRRSVPGGTNGDEHGWLGAAGVLRADAGGVHARELAGVQAVAAVLVHLRTDEERLRARQLAARLRGDAAPLAVDMDHGRAGQGRDLGRDSEAAGQRRPPPSVSARQSHLVYGYVAHRR